MKAFHKYNSRHPIKKPGIVNCTPKILSIILHAYFISKYLVPETLNLTEIVSVVGAFKYP